MVCYLMGNRRYLSIGWPKHTIQEVDDAVLAHDVSLNERVVPHSDLAIPVLGDAEVVPRMI